MRHIFSLAIIGISLSGCGGGSKSTPPASNIANTSVQSFLPFRAGNSWTFSSSGKIIDAGQISVALLNGAQTTAEQFNIFKPDGTSGGSFIFDKGNWPLSGPFANDRITYLAGTGASPSLIIPGIPIIDDTPQAGEILQVVSGGAVVSSTTISSVSGTQALGSQMIDRVAQTTSSGNGSPSGSGFGFAEGIGFTSVTSSGQTTTLTSFSVSTSSATDAVRAVKSLDFSASAVKPDTNAIAKLLSSLF